MKFNNIDDLLIATWENHLDIAVNNCIAIDTNYPIKIKDIDKDFLKNFNAATEPGLRVTIQKMMQTGFRACYLLNGITNEIVDHLISEMKKLNEEYYNYLKFNFDIRIFTKKLDIEIHPEIPIDSYYLLVDSLYNYYDIRKSFTGDIKNVLYFIENSNKMSQFNGNIAGLKNYFDDSNVEELLIICLNKNYDISTLSGFEKDGNTMIYTNTTRKLIISKYPNSVICFNGVL